MAHSDAEVAGERDLLVASLDDARHAVVAALTGLPAALLREPLVWPDGSLLAIVNHLAHLERWWFAYTFAGLDVTSSPPWRLERTHTAGGVLASYRGACERSRLITERAALDDAAARASPSGRKVVLRWVILHMLGETSRHAGHADVLRELIDGLAVAPPCVGDDAGSRRPRRGDRLDRERPRRPNPIR